jgi:hypothetical protein
MKREKALEVARVLCRVEQLESQLDYLNALPSEAKQEVQTSQEFPAYGFTEEDMEELVEFITVKLDDQLSELELL